MNFESPQLFMRLDALDALPPLDLPDGMSVRTEREGDEAVWEALVERAFDTHYSFEKMMRRHKGYRPDSVRFVCRDGKEIATAAAVEQDWFPGEGWLHMVGTDPVARGTGAGRLAVLAALHRLAEYGFKTAVLSTDDFRLPAISLYLSLGFRPLILRDDHAERWARVKQKLEEGKRK